MSNNQQAKYELLKEQHNDFSNNYTWLRLCILISLCVASTIAVFITWSTIYRQSLNFPPQLIDIPHWWVHRAESYSYNYNKINNINNSDNKLYLISSFYKKNDTIIYKQIENERIYPSKLHNFIYKPINDDKYKIVCYYAIPNNESEFNSLYLNNIDSNLCTHINIGVIYIVKNQLHIDNKLDDILKGTKNLKIKNHKLKILLWVGSGDQNSVIGFKEMIKNHANRKLFIQSLKYILEKYHLDGIDLDWEFPTVYNRERQHFSQLLHEIRREYEREHRTYLLSVAVAAVEGIAYFAYDIREINEYTDYVNIMTYDYHFYTKNTPFTGINSPLYARHNEHSILATLNINYSINYWLNHGLDKKKIIVGLPTYGHSFRLVNPFNNNIGSPAQNYGSLGTLGFVSYSDICWFQKNNIYIENIFDIETCSPYMYSGLEWISYDNEKSLECKAKYIKKNDYGGAMIFSLNTDDYKLNCLTNDNNNNNNNNNNNSDDNDNKNQKFPLVRKIRSVLYDNDKNIKR